MSKSEKDLEHAVSCAYTISCAVTTFYADSVGRGIDLERELSLLLEWEEASLAGIRAARKLGRPSDMRMIAERLEECRVYLAINAEEKPR